MEWQFGKYFEWLYAYAMMRVRNTSENQLITAVGC